MSKLALVIVSNAKQESRARLDNSEKAEWQEAVDLASALLISPAHARMVLSPAGL